MQSLSTPTQKGQKGYLVKYTTGTGTKCCRYTYHEYVKGTYRRHCRKARYNQQWPAGMPWIARNRTHFWNNRMQCWIKRKAPLDLKAPYRRREPRPGTRRAIGGQHYPQRWFHQQGGRWVLTPAGERKARKWRLERNKLGWFRQHLTADAPSHRFRLSDREINRMTVKRLKWHIRKHGEVPRGLKAALQAQLSALNP